MMRFDSDAIRPSSLANSSWLLALALSAATAFASATDLSLASAQESSVSEGNAVWRSYLAARVERIEERLVGQQPPAAEMRQQLFEMLGLDPLPSRTDLNVVVTQSTERDGVIVDALHFQSSPGLYVTANLYRPSNATGKLPAVLYLCGHGAVKHDGISYGNKVHYQHHGWWLARHGMICLTLDSLQLGEIEGIHHGTYNHNRWWWLSRGYTPAGVEAWNCIRALDLLEQRDDVDATRLGCTGRSGGGAYSWWIAALDSRIQCAVPVAGITDLRDHVIDDCVEGHCDCMFFVNTYRWDYPQVAALVAPRPLMIANTDRDPIFPLAGLVRTHRHVASVYQQHQAAESLALLVTPGGHDDTQDLQVPTLRWLRHHLADVDEPISLVPQKKFAPQELRVFQELPPDQLNTTIDENFVSQVEPATIPTDAADQAKLFEEWRERLMQLTLAPWSGRSTEAKVVSQTSKRVELNTEDGLITTLLLSPRPAQVHRVRVVLLDNEDSIDQLQVAADENEWVVGCLTRGSGATAWQGDERSITQFHRRLYLVGETLEAGRVWDLRVALRYLADELAGTDGNPADASQSGATSELKVSIHAQGTSGWVAALAAIQEPSVDRLLISGYSSDREQRPVLLNFDRCLTAAELLVLAAQRAELQLDGIDSATQTQLQSWSAALGWPETRLQFLNDSIRESP